MRRRLLAALTGIVGALALSMGISAPATAAPARINQNVDLGHVFTTGTTCAGKAMANVVVTGTGKASATGGWYAWTPKVLGPCSAYLAVSWHNLRTGRSGKIVQKSTDVDTFHPGSFVANNIAVGSGPVRFRLTASGFALSDPTRRVTVVIP